MYCTLRVRSTTLIAVPSFKYPPRLATAGPALPIGRPRDADVVVGPLVSDVQRERVLGYIARGSSAIEVEAEGRRRAVTFTCDDPEAVITALRDGGCRAVSEKRGSEDRQ